MTTRPRPPLNLTDPEPEARDDALFAGPTGNDGAPDPVRAPEPETSQDRDDAVFDRPISERRRRRLAEARRLELQLEGETPSGDPAERALAPAHPTAEMTADPAPAAPPASPTEGRRALETRVATGGAPSTGSRVAPGVAAALWIAGVAAWAIHQQGAGPVDPLALAVYALLALAPAGMLLMLAQAMRQGAILAAETRRARDLSAELIGPTALAAHQAGDVLTRLRGDIDQAAVAAERARGDMVLLRQVLSEETARLNEAAEQAGRSARRIGDALSRERDGLTQMGARLDDQAAGVLDAVDRQSRMVAEASDLAQAQLREAEAALAARAGDLAAAAGEAQDAARLAAEDLARQTIRLETAGSGVAEQILSVEEGLGQQRAALVTAAYALRTDQEDFSAQVESQRAQLAEQVSAARTATGVLNDNAAQAGVAAREVVEAAADQFRALVDMSRREADGFDAATKTALDRFEALAAEARDVLAEETRRTLAALEATAVEQRRAADDAAGQAEIRADRLGEALFDAAQKADAAADARVQGARRIVSETADLVDETGERALGRLDALAARMTEALGQVDAALAGLDERAARLPEAARARAEEVRTTVEQGLAALSDAGRRAAAETEALDAEFQARVRRNYQMLTEAARLMGVVSGDGAAPRPRGPDRDDPAGTARESRRSASQARPAPEAGPEPAPDTDRDAPPRSLRDERTPSATAPEGQRGFGLRGRLRLAPADDLGGRARGPAPAGERAEAAPLDWDDLLDGGQEPPLTLDTPAAPPTAEATDDDGLGARMTAAVRRMGVDPNALLPRSRIEEAAAAWAMRESDRMRQIVRRVAPAAVRSVSRRVIGDPALKADAERFIRAFSDRLEREGRGDTAGALGVLATDPGRAFLILDAAVGDMA